VLTPELTGYEGAETTNFAHWVKRLVKENGVGGRLDTRTGTAAVRRISRNTANVRKR